MIDHGPATFKVGDRVFVKRIRTRDGIEHGGYAGVIASLPGTAPSIPRGLYGVIVTDGRGKQTVIGVAEELLEKITSPLTIDSQRKML